MRLEEVQETARHLIALLGPTRAEDHAHGAWELAHRLCIPNGDEEFWTAVRVEIQRELLGV